MPLAGRQRQKHRITTATIEVEGKSYNLTFCPDGLHVRQKFKGEKVHSLSALISFSETKIDPPAGSVSETLQLAAEDLMVIAREVYQRGGKVNSQMIAAAKQQVLKAQRIIRSLETLSN